MITRPSLQNQPQQPGKAASRPRRRGLRGALLVAAMLASAGGLTLAASGIASASADQTSPQWAELGGFASSGGQSSQVTFVYTIRNVAEPGTEMLEDNSNSMAADATVDVWTQWYQQTAQDPMATASDPQITQANYLWEFVPDNPGTGSSIVRGYGELINRQSGLCLDDNGSPDEQGDGATITQYYCNGGANQQWKAQNVPSTSSYQLQPEVDNGAGTLGVGNGSTCSPQGDGDSVYVRTTGTSGNSCDEWNIQQASYDFATNPISVPGVRVADPSPYGCLAADTLRQNENSANDTPWDYDNLSGPDVVPVMDTSPPPDQVPVGGVQYINFAVPAEETGQVMLYCDPSSTSL